MKIRSPKIGLIMAIVFLSISIKSFAQDLFVISPYIVLGDHNKLSLNYRPNTDLNLKIEVSIKNTNIENFEKETFANSSKAFEFQKINLGKLECDKELIYRLTSSKPFLDATYSYKAFPCSKKQDLYFGFMSDTQIKDASGQKRADKISQFITELKDLYPFSVIVNAGDVVQHGGSVDDWNNYFKTAAPYLKNNYMFAAVGNHDYYDSETYEKAPPQFLNYLRDNQSSELGNAVLDLGRVSIIMLNSNFDYMNDVTYKEQWDWFIHQLDENQKLNKPVIVSMHHSPFSSSAEWVRAIPTKLREELVPTLEKYSCVKMMISGHLHMYERSQKGRLPYLVAGPSGGIINYITYSNPYKIVIKPFSTTFSVFKMTDKNIEVITYTGQKEVIDQFSVDL
jgi:hypothetical protein